MIKFNFMQFFNYRMANCYAALVCITVLLFALYLQLHDQIDPCPLCVLQRLTFLILVILFLIATIYPWKKIGKIIWHSIIYLILISGIIAATRQIYLQHLPKELIPSCGPGLNFIIQNLPFHQAMRLIFMGTGECAEIHWRFMDLNIAEWSLISFIILSILNGWQFYRIWHNKV